MPHSLCKRFGLTPTVRLERLAILGATVRDAELAVILHNQVIVPNLQSLVERYFDRLLTYPEAHYVFERGYSVKGLKQIQQHYLLSFGMNVDSESYFEQRLRVGFEHARVRVRPSLYQYALHLLQQLILDYIAPALGEREELIRFVVRITALDASLALEAYENVILARFKQSVDTLTEEKTNARDKIDKDALTGLLSRKRILELLDKRLHRTSDSRHVSIVMGDLDRFKRINDEFGHVIADELLRGIANRIRSATRRVNAIGRFGGEEFLIVLKDTSAAQAVTIAERIRQRVAVAPLSVQHAVVPLTMSLGVAQSRPNESAADLVRRADKALMAAKDNGRNRVELELGHLT